MFLNKNRFQRYITRLFCPNLPKKFKKLNFQHLYIFQEYTIFPFVIPINTRLLHTYAFYIYITRTLLKKYPPSGDDGTHSLPATSVKSKMAVVRIQNGRPGLERAQLWLFKSNYGHHIPIVIYVLWSLFTKRFFKTGQFCLSRRAN